ncbi:MAG TPA: hypothetical protein VEI52_27015 [Terriglobales bacterium]|nr:hypothetical protein [Terriglobales bacterium]
MCGGLPADNRNGTIAGLTVDWTGQKINFSTVFAGQAVGIKEVQDDIWLVSSMDYDLG